jgi:predicted AAA+ superfamily ATPase
VLRLMAQVIHELWMSGDPSVMIMPGSVAISSARVEPELLHYLPMLGSRSSRATWME